MMTVDEWWGLPRHDRLLMLDEVKKRRSAGIDAEYVGALEEYLWLLDKFIQAANHQRLRNEGDPINPTRIMASVLAEPFIHRHIGGSEFMVRMLGKIREDVNQLVKVVVALFPSEFSGVFVVRGAA